MDLKRLRHLVALAEERNFGRAAERVHLSQPAFSRSIQAAEAEFELRLFERGSAEVTPTPAGAFVIERARKLVFATHCLDRDLELYRNRQAGDLAIGFGPFPAATLLQALMPELSLDFPNVRLRVEIANPRQLEQQLRREELDFFVADTRSFETGAELEITPLAKLFGGFYVRTGHPLAGGQPARPADLVFFGLATVRLPNEVRSALASFMGLEQDAALPIRLECDDIPTLKLAVLDSDAILLAVHAAMSADVASGQFVPLPVTGAPPLYSRLGVVSLRGRTHSPLAEAVIERLQALAEPFTESIPRKGPDANKRQKRRTGIA